MERAGTDDNARGAAARRLVVEWQGPLYNLAFRMLGNEADASDATQEVFAAVLRRADRYDTERDFRAWIYRVATREIARYASRLARKVAREKEVAMQRDGLRDPMRDATEDRELRALVEEAVSELSSEDRAPLVLEYFCGLTQTEVARVLELPRTTVRHRVRRALEVLRARLRHTGYAAVAIDLEAILSATAPAPVPMSLGASLLRAASESRVAAGALPSVNLTQAALAAGGITMKKSIAIASLLGLLGWIVGFGVGRGSGAPNEPQESTPVARDEGVSRAEHDRVLAELASAREALQESTATSADRAIDRQADGGTPEPDSVAAAPAGPEASSESEGTGIDWGDYPEQFAALADRLATLLDPNGVDGAPEITPEEQMELMKFMMASREIGAQVGELARNPFFEAEILGELLESVLAKTLDLSSAQVGSLADLARLTLEQSAAASAIDGATPLELHHLRRDLVEDLRDGVGDVLTVEQGQRFDQLRPVVENVLRGRTAGVTEVGVDSPDGGAEAVLGVFEYQYGLTGDQMGSSDLRRVVDEYVSSAADLLDRYGADASSDPLMRARIEEELLILQIRTEERVLPFLDDAQRAAVFDKDPFLLRFGSGTGIRNQPVLGLVF